MISVGLTVLCLLGATLCAQADSFEGLAGRELADSVRARYLPRPSDNIRVPTPEPWIDPASTDVSRIIPDEWWFDAPPRDLYNLMGTSPALEAARRTYPPAPLTAVTASGPGWQAGTATVAGIDINAWQPEADRRGDLARRVMYMALMYPSRLWRSHGVNILEDGGWPLMTAFGAEAMMAWHAADPPDARELAETARIRDAQENGNPFTDMPLLPRYLWGDLAGQGYVPDSSRERVPLKGTYSISADVEIDLYSPYIPAGAHWKIDGRDIEGSDALPLEGMERGVHVLEFAAPDGTCGKLKINILP